MKAKDENKAIVTSEEKADLPAQVFQALEKRDENQILAEMRGDFLEDLVYDITIKGKRVTNLSYAGVKEAVRRRGHVEILEYHTEETDKEIRALIRVRDLDNQIDVLGASAAEKDKPFSYVLAVNKAERNAFAKLIPAKWLAVLIDEYMSRRGKGTPAQQVSTPIAETAKTEPGQVLAYLKNVLRGVMKKDVVYTPATIVDLIRVDAPWASENDVGTIMQQLLKIKEVEQVYDGEVLRGWRKTEKAKSSQVTGPWTLSKIQEVFPQKLEEMLEFEESPEWILIRPRGYLGGDNFGKIAEIIRDQLKGEYISAGKDSHFRIARLQDS